MTKVIFDENNNIIEVEDKKVSKFTEIESKFKGLMSSGILEKGRDMSKYMDLETGLQRIDDSFVTSEKCFGECFEILSSQLPSPEEALLLYAHPKWISSNVAIKRDVVLKIEEEIHLHESESDLMRRVYNNPYPLHLDQESGYIFAGSYGRGKTTNLLTHFAGDSIRSVVRKERVIYIDYLKMLKKTWWEEWESKRFNLLRGLKAIYINDFANSKVKSGYEGDEIKENIRELIFHCYSHGINLNLTTNIPSNEFKDYVEEMFGESIVDRLPKKVISFEGKSFRS